MLHLFLGRRGGGAREECADIALMFIEMLVSL